MAREEYKTGSKGSFWFDPGGRSFLNILTFFKHTLSGSIGKNLLNMEFPMEQEMPDGTQAFLVKLRNSRLEDEMLVEEFYQKVIDYYIHTARTITLS